MRERQDKFEAASTNIEFRISDFRAARCGSALILAVVLTSLLAVVGVLFVLAARIDKMATSATADNRQLGLAVDTVLARINDVLVQDVPGVGNNQKCYNYPDANNPWLASSTPDANGPKYSWRQISNIAGLLPAASTRNVPIRVVGEREPINLNDPNTNANASGDGVGDARWFVVPGITSSKGKPLYAAVRILDNGGMLNVNTGYKFDPSATDPNQVDGSSQLQVNVLALAVKPGDFPSSANETDLRNARAGTLTPPQDWAAYERQVIWRYPGDPNRHNPSPCTPFDLSDELELRYRFLLNRQDVDTRLETWGRLRANALATPVDDSNGLAGWFRRVSDNPLNADYFATRTIATTYSVDRILMPQAVGTSPSHKMVNVNTASPDVLRNAIAAALSETDPNAVRVAARALQITANLLDYRDPNDEVTELTGGSAPYYGFERPCIYLSELACRQMRDVAGVLHASYAIELFKPYFEDADPKAGAWQLVIDNPPTRRMQIGITWSGSRRFHVLLAEDPLASLKTDYVQFVDAEEPTDPMPRYGYNQASYPRASQDLGTAVFAEGATISLQRKVASGAWITVDSKQVPPGWIKTDGVARSLQRDISPHKCIRRLWAPATQTSTPGLGNAQGNYVDTARPEIIQAHPANKPLQNIGELGLVFARSAYEVPEGATAADCLIDLQNPMYRKLCNYLTVIDPYNPLRRPALPAGETRIMGRLNINTASSLAIAQLPWVSQRTKGSLSYALARAIVAYRDKLNLSADGIDYRNRPGQPGFRSIADLLNVQAIPASGTRDYSIAYYALDGKDQAGFPDLTPGDGAVDDREERDLIFTRISDLVTLRSDVFTAYILVRIGTNGPQKRVIAILDRSRVNSANDRVRLVALYPVPDPR